MVKSREAERDNQADDDGGRGSDEQFVIIKDIQATKEKIE